VNTGMTRRNIEDRENSRKKGYLKKKCRMTKGGDRMKRKTRWDQSKHHKGEETIYLPGTKRKSLAVGGDSSHRSLGGELGQGPTESVHTWGEGGGDNKRRGTERIDYGKTTCGREELLGREKGEIRVAGRL